MRIPTSAAVARERPLKEAESVYREALSKCGADGLLLFNLAVLMEDLKRQQDAADAYRAALSADPDMADATTTWHSFARRKACSRKPFVT